jgi:hypothetical protein
MKIQKYDGSSWNSQYSGNFFSNLQITNFDIYENQTIMIVSDLKNNLYFGNYNPTTNTY